MEGFNLSKFKKDLFAKASASQDKNKDEDLITKLYEEGGKRFRSSLPGKVIKNVITSDLVKTGRDKILDTVGAPEHYKQFAQYLTGGTVGNKDITELPDDVRKDIKVSHMMGNYPEKFETITSPKYGQMEAAAKKEAELTGDDSSYKSIVHGSGAKIPNPDYNPESTLLSTYGRPDRTAYTLGHVQFKPDQDGGFTMTDTYKVDSNESFGDAPYKPLRGYKSDLREGGRLASRAYDLAKFFGVNQPMKYNVKFKKEDMPEPIRFR
tara:strand:+ start:954 stop:1748 length:795 start_codon:yes stop_codon:yes gene_type:complete